MPYALVTSEPRMVPKDRSVLVTSSERSMPFPAFCALRNVGTSSFMSRVSSSRKSYSSPSMWWTALQPPSLWLPRMFERSTMAARWVIAFSFTFRKSVRPTSSSTVRTPSLAMISRSSSAMYIMKLMTYSGFPAKRARRRGSWVAMPTGQVFWLQTRIMTQPMEISGVVAKPNSSAPSMQAMATSRPVISLPSASTRTRVRRPFWMSVWWVSARPSSSGRPALWSELSGAAPEPPSYPEMRMTSAPPLATPEAMVPTPASETSLTLMRASRLAFFRS